MKLRQIVNKVPLFYDTVTTTIPTNQILSYHDPQLCTEHISKAGLEKRFIRRRLPPVHCCRWPWHLGKTMWDSKRIQI